MTTNTNGKHFASYLGELGNSAFIAHGLAIGLNLGLFDVMVSIGKPANSSDIAETGKFKERYVREWLSLMVTGNVLKYNSDDQTYFIPEKRIPYLIGEGKEGHSASMVKCVHVVTAPHFEIEQCFKSDGPKGVPYTLFHDLHPLRAEWNKTKFTWPFIEHILKQVPGLCEKLEKGLTVCDAGCSSAVQIITLAKQYPKSTFLGFDIDEHVKDLNAKEAKELGLTNISFIAQDGCNMPSDWTNRYDLLTTWEVVHDVPRSKIFLKEIERVIKPGGLFLMCDAKAHSELGDNLASEGAISMYGTSLFHCMPVSLFYDGEGLGSMWGIEKQKEYLKEAGFNYARILPIDDEDEVYFICEKKTVILET